MRYLFIFTFLLLSFLSSAQAYKKLQDKASAECERGNFEKAIELSEEAITLATKTKNTDPEELLCLRSENAAYYLLNEQVDKGIGLFDALIKEVEAGKLLKAELSVRQNFGVALIFLNRQNEALAHLDRAYELSKSQTIKPADLITIVGSLAVCYQYRYEFEKAETTFKTALDILKKEKMLNTVDYATMLNSLALLYKDMQLPEKALEKYHEAELVFNKTKDTINPQFPVFLTEYGSMLAEVGQYEKALTFCFRGRNLDKQLYTEQSNEYSGALNNLGFIYAGMNRIIETEQFYEEAIKIKKSLPYVDLGSYLTSVSNLMNFYNRVGRSNEALELAKELENGLLKKEFTDTIKRAVFANNLAILYQQHEQYLKSQNYFKDALMYYEAVYGKGNAFESEIYINMGTLFQVQEKYEDCAIYLNKAAEVYKKTGKEQDDGDINTICNLVMILRNIGKVKEAQQYVDKAIELASKTRVQDSDVLEQLYIAKAQVSADLDQVKEAMDYFNKFLELKYDQLEKNFSYMTENEKMFFLQQFELTIRNFYTTILNNIEKYPELIKTLLDFRLKTKGLLLNNLTKIKNQLSDLNNPLLNQQFESLKLKRETIAKLLNFDTKEYPYALAEAIALKEEADKLEKEISLKVSGLAANHMKVVDWKSIQKQLAPNEAAIEVFQSYLIYDKGQGKGTNYTYMIIKATGNPLAVSIDRPVTWEDEVLKLYKKSMENTKDNPELYVRLWKGVNEQLAGISTVYLSPDGIYNQININTLINGETNKYVIEEKNLHLLTSLRDITAIKQAKSSKPQNCVLVGNPSFDYDISKLSGTQEQMASAVATRGAFGFVLSELPGTKEEVTEIRNTLEKNGMHASLFTEINANEHDVKKVKSPDVLHIATHGFFLKDPKPEDLMGYGKVQKEFYTNPMMRCGIFFSGANKTYSLNTANINSLSDFEDGMLTGYEAMNLNLDKTELVVLSACQTGLGKIKNGEGVYGLQRAFKLAGAKSIIMSLWSVSDEATKDLMIAFYASWIKSGDVYNAFREAQLEVKKKYPEPYYWGAFVLNGK